MKKTLLFSLILLLLGSFNYAHASTKTTEQRISYLESVIEKNNQEIQSLKDTISQIRSSLSKLGVKQVETAPPFTPPKALTKQEEARFCHGTPDRRAVAEYRRINNQNPYCPHATHA